jgi:hypothetical protein
LIQNKTDGKLVELPSRHGNADDDPSAPGVPSGGPNRAARRAEEKAEAVGLEYSALLSSQLASQRAYYSDMVSGLKDEVAKLETKGKKADKAVELARTLQRDLASEREMTKGLLANLHALREENKANAEQTATLKGEVRLRSFAEASSGCNDRWWNCKSSCAVRLALPSTSGSAEFMRRPHVCPLGAGQDRVRWRQRADRRHHRRPSTSASHFVAPPQSEALILGVQKVPAHCTICTSYTVILVLSGLLSLAACAHTSHAAAEKCIRAEGYALLPPPASPS